MSNEEKLKELVEHAIRHLSCGYVSNSERIHELNYLQRGLHNIEAAQHGVQRTCATSPDGYHHFEVGETLIICMYCGASR